MNVNKILARVINDQRWKREKMKRKLRPPICNEELVHVENTYEFMFPPLLKHILSKSEELYMLNSCTGLQPFKVEFTESTMKKIDNSLCLCIAHCGCNFATWVRLDGPGKGKVFETIGENIIKDYENIEKYFEEGWGKMTTFDYLVESNPCLRPRNYQG